MPSENEIEAAAIALLKLGIDGGVGYMEEAKDALEAAEKVREPALKEANARIKELEEALTDITRHLRFLTNEGFVDDCPNMKEDLWILENAEQALQSIDSKE